MSEKNKGGRPFGSTGAYKEVKKNETLCIRVTPEEKEKIQELADKEGLPVSKFILSKLNLS